MVITCILLVSGMILLVKGADLFVDGSCNIARALKIPPLVIGLTLVSIGTSAPEASVSLIGSIKGLNDLSFGNVIGSNIFNTLLILGLSALIIPTAIGKDVKKYDLPAMLVLYLMLILFAFVITPLKIDVFEGVILFVLFISYAVWLILRAKKSGSPQQNSKAVKKGTLIKSVLFAALGLAGIIFGGKLVVDNASKIAKAFGMSESLVGLTIVAAGTSLPELVTSVVAAIKKENDIAIGNIVGSNIFNIAFITGLSSAISPIALTHSSLADLLVMLASGALIAVFALFSSKITRTGGALFVIMYIGYLTYIIIRN